MRKSSVGGAFRSHNSIRWWASLVDLIYGFDVRRCMDVNRFFEEDAKPQGKWDSWKEQNKGKSTPALYQSGIDYFMSFYKIDSYDELLEVQMEASRRGATDPLSKYILVDMIKKCVNHRIEVDGVSGNHAKTIKSAVQKFIQLCGFDDFYIRLPRGTTKRNSNGGSEILTPEQLNIVLGVTTELMHKAIVLTLRDSGLRLGDVLSFDMETVSAGINGGTEFFYLSKLTEKTGERAQSVIGFEALNAIRDWVRFRVSRGEVLKEDTPLFIMARAKNGVKSKQDYKENIALKTNQRLTRGSASNIVSRLFSKAGFDAVTAHGLRKVHSTYLGIGEDRVSEPMIARMEGREIGDSREAYKVYPPQALIDAYEKNYYSISLEKTETKQLKNTNKTLAQLLKIAITENETLASRMTPEMVDVLKKLAS